MSYLPPAIRSQIIAKINAKEAQLAIAQAAFEKALDSSDVESYQFDSKEGKQATTLRSPSVLSKLINDLEAQLERLYRRLNGTGLVSLNLRRRS